MIKFSGIDWRKVLTFDGLKDIFVGCGNATLIQLGEAPDLLVSTQSFRKEMICDNCPMQNESDQCDPTRAGEAVVNFVYGDEERFKGITYNGCGCNTFCKTANLEQSCPLGKWLQIQKVKA